MRSRQCQSDSSSQASEEPQHVTSREGFLTALDWMSIVAVSHVHHGLAADQHISFWI